VGVPYPDHCAYVNLQHTGPYSADGIFNVGIRHTPDLGPASGDQSGVSAWLNGVGIIIQHGGAWRFVLEASYDSITLNAPVNILPLTDGVVAPGAIPGTAQIYVDIADGDLKVIFGDGIVKTLAIDT
jgi:hypothetical protein